jgi:hypothetical protein
VLLRAMGLPEEVREAARAVRRRRDGAGEAARVIGWFEGWGSAPVPLSRWGMRDSAKLLLQAVDGSRHFVSNQPRRLITAHVFSYTGRSRRWDDRST